MANGDKPSPVEVFKQDSNYLLGDIGQELSDESGSFGKGSVQMLKHHGVYQQDDRDVRMAARQQGKSGKTFSFMVRSKVPGGRLTSAQLLAELDICDALANGTLRITSRQALQLHGVLKTDLHQVIARINQTQLSTLGACGDVNRNVMCCPAPYASAAHQEAQDFADRLAEHFAPRTPAYRELWLKDLDGGASRQVEGVETPDEIEPLYGRHYLPRKFKMAIAFPDDNCVDLCTHDLGFLAIVEEGRITGYNLWVGGGQGVTPSAKKTFPALAQPMGFITPEQALDAAAAVVRVQRDFGNRSDRKVARLKYLVHNWGMVKFRGKVEEYLGWSLAPLHPTELHGFNDHLGWEPQGEGRWCYGLNVENGRVKDGDAVRLKLAPREICGRLAPEVRLTSHQSILFANLGEDQKDPLLAILRDHGVPLTEEVSTVRRWSMACVAWPTCGLAITESERALPGILDQLETELARLGLSDERFTVRMTGCPNGCARPYNSDVGLVGKAKDRYTVFLGGRLLGDRLSFIYQDLVPRDRVVPVLASVFAYFQQDRHDREGFGDFCHRKGQEDLLAWSEKHAQGGGS